MANIMAESAGSNLRDSVFLIWARMGRSQLNGDLNLKYNLSIKRE
jgi:hypothetical protein